MPPALRKFGGVLAVAGDDHAARSSTVAHQTEHIFKAVMMPVLAPSGVQDYLDLGLHGWAMSRYSGCWVAFKAVADTIESSASVYVDPQRVDIALPDYPYCRRAASTSAGRTTAWCRRSACCTTSSTPPSPMPASTS
jgi:TPP-dependent indolepyruvate ferredoxin oxidoreductase alpha subunit